MESYYDIFQGDQKVGQVKLSQKGLYYYMQCSAEFQKSGLYRLWAYTEKEKKDLGVMLAAQDRFYLNTAVPQKNFTGKIREFRLQDQQDKTESWLPISEDAPFKALQRLKTARLQFVNGQPGAVWEE